MVKLAFAVSAGVVPAAFSSVRRRGGLFSAACRVVARLGRLGEEESGTFPEVALLVPGVLFGSAFALILSLGFGLGLGGATGWWALRAGVRGFVVTNGLCLIACNPGLELVFQKGVAELSEQARDIARREISAQEVG